jgi:hypothetical protein
MAHADPVVGVPIGPDPVFPTALVVYVRRIYSEYLEMPGLRLTCAQAQRLWGIEAATCSDALQLLMDAGFLRRTDNGQFVRLTDGSVTTPPLRMAKAELKLPQADRSAR